ncbi:TonB-dependent receptor [Sphingomonas sp. ASV193]|uniref:TonB-dependent receptor n=1 Tax=Sphingomonas sp. ASV193 TaxID=3144405 RepID=UPI0032E8F4C7
MKKLILLSTAAAVVMPAAAFAQSTGTVEAEKDAIVVTGTRKAKGTDGVVIQDSTKAKGLLTQEFIAKQSPGQTVLNTINYIPGVNFTQNDPYGSSGGNLRIRGFDGARVSLTFDGAQLNDSGNYAVYSNQQIDPELIEQVNVNLGATDVDSPTASAAGGTVNYRTLIPTNQPGFQVDGSLGTFNFRRVFGMINTGTFTPWGTKAWIAASDATYDLWRGPGQIKKWQVNGKLYQPLANGDFIALAGHYNHNRNNNYNNPTLSDLRSIFGVTTVPTGYTSGSPLVVGDFTDDQWAKINSLGYVNSCLNSAGAVQTRPAGGPGAQSDPSTCYTPEGPLASQASTNLYYNQINPSNTGNIRGQSRFTIADNLIFTFDPTYQYVLANGGTQTVLLKENDPLLKNGVAGSTGVDLNADGDTLDTLLVGRPSITNTHRWTVLSSLLWKINPNNTFRVSYSFDRAHHRQTGEYSFTNYNFAISNPFFGRNGDPIRQANGSVLQNRDRTSIALLNQLSGQYIGKFVDSRLRVELGLRSPWFQRNLDQHCYTPAAGSGFPVCVQPSAVSATPNSGYYLVPNSYVPPVAGLLGTPVYAPFTAKYKYHKLLPNVGLTYALTNSLSVFGSYAKGFSAPRTDNLYRQPMVNVIPETTDSFDLGARFINRRVQAQATAWKINYQNRIVTSYDPTTNTSIDRNVGKVNSWGVDTSVGVSPFQHLNLLGLLSYTNAKLKQDVLLGNALYVPVAIPATATSVAIGKSAAVPGALTGETYYCNGLPSSFPTASGVYTYPICARTAGKFVVETPRWQYGGRAEVNFAPVTLGIQAKHVGKRYATDVNDVVVKGYTTVDLDARLDLAFLPARKSYLQVNVINLFNAHYFGNLSTTINAFGSNASAPRFTPVASRAISATLNVGL